MIMNRSFSTTYLRCVCLCYFFSIGLCETRTAERRRDNFCFFYYVSCVFYTFDFFFLVQKFFSLSLFCLLFIPLEFFVLSDAQFFLLWLLLGDSTVCILKWRDVGEQTKFIDNADMRYENTRDRKISSIWSIVWVSQHFLFKFKPVKGNKQSMATTN